MEVQLNRKDINERWGITIKENFGATYVAKLVPGTPAGSSGLEIGDVITHVNSKDLRTHGKRQVLEIIRQLRSMSMKFERSKDSSKKPPTEEGAVVFISSSFEEDAATPPKIARKESGKIAKKRGRPAGSTKKGSKFKLVKPKTSQPIMKTMLEQLAESSDSENEQSTKNADVELEHQQTRREKLKERKTSTSLKKSKKAKSRTPSITTFDCPPPLEDCSFISPCYVAKSPHIDPYSWEEENPYKQMKNGEAKSNGNTIKITENNPLDHLAKCAEVELTKIAEDNAKKCESLQASLLEQEIVIDELKKARLEERRKIDEAEFKNKQTSRAYKSLQLSSRLEIQKIKEDLKREKTKNTELQEKYSEMKDAQDSVCKELSKTRSDLKKALANAEASKQTRAEAVSKATELMLLLQTDEC